MAAKNSTKEKLTPYQEEMKYVLQKIIEYKEVCEANIVCNIYHNPDLLRENHIELKEIQNNCWKVYFEIARELILVEKKQTLDAVTTNLFLTKHKSLASKWEEYGGYETIEKSISYIKESNFFGYLDELHKWNAVSKLVTRGFCVDRDKIKKFCDMTSEEIYQEYEAYLNDTFANVDSDVKSYNISDGIFELIDELDKGMAIGLPYYNMPMLTNETGGQYFGSITLVGGLSNVGKSSFARNSVLPSIIKEGEKIVMFLNEDGISKTQREFLAFVLNNIIKFDIQKHTIRDGHYSEEVKEKLKEAAQWIKDKSEDHTITIIPFQQYRTDKVIKLIKKYSAMGVKYFLLDTFKMDSGKVEENFWADMQQKMVDINDIIKPEALNVHILITFQLSKGSTARQRYYTQDNIGISKNIVDPASTCIMIRNLWESEYPGEKQELKVYRMDGKNGKTKIPVKLNPEKNYQIIFIVKNREGSANKFQIVNEVDLSTNVVKEIGFTSVPMDF